jgi:hypothetical protein
MDKQMKRYFIVNVPPHHLCGKYKTSVAASNFSWALINSDVFDAYYSILPSNIAGPVDDIEMKGLVYSSLRYKGRILSKLAIFVENWTVFKRIEKQSSVWLYNIGILNSLLFFLIKWFKPSVKLNAILLDLAVPKRRISTKSIILWMMNHCDGTIRLANSELFTCKNSLCMPGVVPESTLENPKVETVKMSFLLSGQLRNDISQTQLIIDAFGAIPEISLKISGFAVDITEKDLKTLCDKYDNVTYYGNVSFEKYLELLHDSPFLLSTRDPKIIDNKANFPSKIIEAILHNRIIVSTIHYEQLNGLNYFEVSSDLKSLINDLKKIAALENIELLKCANQSQYAREHFCPSEWDKAMCQIENTYTDLIPRK